MAKKKKLKRNIKKKKVKKTLGLIEQIKIFSKSGKEKKILAKIDTGASKCSIDTKLAARLKLGPIIRTKLVKSAEGNSMRPIVKATIIIKNRKFEADFTIADRKHLRYDILIGVNVLKNGFIIDPSKNNKFKKK